MSDNIKGKQALEEWRNENSRRSFGGAFYCPAARAISVSNGLWVLQEYRPERDGEGKPMKGRSALYQRIKGWLHLVKQHNDPWVTVSPALTKDAAAARLFALL